MLKNELADFRPFRHYAMIDYFTIALTHGLIAVAAWRLLFRDDLDSDRARDSDQDDPESGTVANPETGNAT